MPFGIRPVGHISGSDWTSHQRRIPIATNYTTKVYQHDPVTLSSGNIVRGVAAAPILGVLMGVQYIDPNGKQTFKNWWPGLTGCTDIWATVTDDPNLIYEAETGVGVGNISNSYRGAQVDFALGTGDDRLGLSGAYVGGSGGKNFSVYDIPRSPGNELGTTKRRVHLMVLQHVLYDFELST